MNAVLAAWNHADEATALARMLACCGARRWAGAMVAMRPVQNQEELFSAADHIWATMEEPDWLEAFACHPRIGERTPAIAGSQSASRQSRQWSAQEQSGAALAASRVLEELARGNAEYEQRFGFTYIVCATGKSADEMLSILNRRLSSGRAAELREAAEQQRQITHIRLRKWLAA